MGKDTRGFKLSFHWLEKNWETWVTCQAHDTGGQSPSALRGEFLSGRQSLTTILNCFGSCMGCFRTPVLTSLSLFEQPLSIWKSEILNLVKTAIISSLFCSKINRKFIITKDPKIMTWVPSYYMVNLLLIRREGLWFTQKETPFCCAGCRPADNCLVPASFKQEHSPGKTIFCDKVCMRAQLFMAFDSCWNYVECA